VLFLPTPRLIFKNEGPAVIGAGLALAMHMESESPRTRLLHEDVTEKIIGVFFDVYNELGAGFLEKVYRSAFLIAASAAGLEVRRELYMPVWFRGSRIAEFFADFCVEGRALVEIKAKPSLDTTDEAQLINYLRASDMEVGLLLNFGRKAEFKRLVYENSRKKSHETSQPGPSLPPARSKAPSA
jgi:GxxExxY protein